MRRRVAALVSLAVAVFAVAATASAPGARRERLDNGLTVLVRENPLAPVVAVSLLVRGGTRWERAAESGISNFVHAVMVKGTAKRSGADLAEAIAALGGKLSASGEVDYSGISASALARFWRELLTLTAELVLQPKLEPAEVASERDWLLSRIQRRRDSPSARAFDEFYAARYGPHPYGRPTLGTPESLRRIDHAAIVAWYRTFYRPERMVLAVSGQVRADEVVAEARRLFGALPGGPAPAPPSNPAPPGGARRVVVEHPAQQAQVVAGGLAPSLDHADHAAVKVLATVLGGGMAGRLFAELRDKQALAYTASAFYDPVREPGLLILYLGTAPDNVERAERALLTEIARVQREPVAGEELERAKGFLLGNYAMDRRTNARQAWYMAFYEVEGVGQDFPDRYRRAVEAVTAESVQRAARTYLDSLTIVLLKPPAGR
ncbi:MAG: M16 family metallopeptidase [Candidatus Rokuibacteriota bacterium]